MVGLSREILHGRYCNHIHILARDHHNDCVVATFYNLSMLHHNIHKG